MGNSVAAVVVTFNRRDMLIECLGALLTQSREVQRIYVIDNASTDGTRELLLAHDLLLNPRIHYTRLARNTGGAGGFAHGMQLAMQDGHDWLWVMDDDAEPARDALEQLLGAVAPDDPQPPPLCSLKCDSEGRLLLAYLGFLDWRYRPLECVRPIADSALENASSVEIEMATFVGLMMPRWLVERIGLPKAEFFIHADDLEYCLRMKGIAKIRLVLASIVLHKEEIRAAFSEVAVFGRSSLRIRFERYWISYYAPRNYIWLARRYGGWRPDIVAQVILTFCRRIAGILVHDDHKVRRVRFVVSQFLDGFRGVFDNDKPKRILYGRADRTA
ncbi:MAG TPA: glycosyltransferase family 2 protein [Steroidobacteraceae bacterium]|nr:glycosyltransferase family 2 protein [Steroidobacteraceae bacterium]